MKQLLKSPMFPLYLLWLAEFLIIQIIVCVAILFVVAVISNVSVWEVIGNMVHLINV